MAGGRTGGGSDRGDGLQARKVSRKFSLWESCDFQSFRASDNGQLHDKQRQILDGLAWPAQIRDVSERFAPVLGYELSRLSSTGPKLLRAGSFLAMER